MLNLKISVDRLLSSVKLPGNCVIGLKVTLRNNIPVNLLILGDRIIWHCAHARLVIVEGKKLLGKTTILLILTWNVRKLEKPLKYTEDIGKDPSHVIDSSESVAGPNDDGNDNKLLPPLISKDVSCALLSKTPSLMCSRNVMVRSKYCRRG